MSHDRECGAGYDEGFRIVKLMALIFGLNAWKVYSLLISALMRLKGAKIGKHFLIMGTPRLSLSGMPGSLVIGDSVCLAGDVDLRTRENGKIIIYDGARIDHGVRMIAANDATLLLEKNTYVGFHSVLNCGCDVTIGEDSQIAGLCYFQSSNHGTKKGILIRTQENTFAPIVVGRDVWIGSHVSVLQGVTIHDGAVIGSKSVVTKDVPADSINAGVPSQVLKYREV